MRIFDVDPARRRVKLRATSAKSEEAFATRLRQIEHSGCHYRCPDRTPRVPRHLADVVQAVLGFDERPCIRRLRSMVEPQGTTNQAGAETVKNAVGFVPGIGELMAVYATAK
jgi:hypothetical protein